MNTMANETVGFVGVGLMGHGMAKNIVEKGYPLTVIAHRNRKPVEDLVSRGATEATGVAPESATEPPGVTAQAPGTPASAASPAAARRNRPAAASE